MKPVEMERLYKTACDYSRQVPDLAQGKLWHRVMGGFEVQDISEGIIAWYATNKYLPMPAELKPLAESARIRRLSASEVKRDLIRWRCPDCGVTTSGWPADGGSNVRYCPGIPKPPNRGVEVRPGRWECLYPMQIIERHAPEEENAVPA